MDATSWWSTALQVAEKAKSVAKTVSQKGMEFAEATAEEASRKLKDIGLPEGVSAAAVAPPPDPEELEAFGISADFQDFVRSLNYGTFRDFPESQLVVLNKIQSAAAGDAAAHRLNPWQVEHAKLVVLAVKEVNELRFVLCPRYMTDERFWHIYFTLVRKYLPDRAYSWAEGDALPVKPGKAGAAAGAFSLGALGDQLWQLGDKLQQQAHAVRQRGAEVAEAPSLRGDAGPVLPAAPSAAAPRQPEAQKSTSSVLDSDPDLEAYLQVAIEEAGNAALESTEDAEGAASDDLDLDAYINDLADELAEEVSDEINGEPDSGTAAEQADEDAPAKKKD